MNTGPYTVNRHHVIRWHDRC